MPLLESQRHSQFLITSAPELETICMHVCVHACMCEDLSQRLYFTRLQRKPAMCFTLSPRSMPSVSRVIFSFFRAQSKLWEHPSHSQYAQPCPPTKVLESSHAFHSRASCDRDLWNICCFISSHESDKPLLSGPGQSLTSSRHKEEAAFLLPTTCLLWLRFCSCPLTSTVW